MVLFMRVAVINVLKDLVDVVSFNTSKSLLVVAIININTEDQRPRICSCSEHLSFEYASSTRMKVP
jgi:hypothetical protein